MLYVILADIWFLTIEESFMKKQKTNESAIIANGVQENPQILSHRKYVYKIILILSLVSLIVPFAAQFILPFFFPECNVVGAEIWNQYVSIILGIVATLMSVVSLKMSFDNVKQSHETELKTRDLLHDIEKHLKDIEHNQDNYLTKNDVMGLGLLRNNYIVENVPNINTQWTPSSKSEKQESKSI